MKAQLRNHVAAIFLLAPVAVTFSALPTAAIAQPATPEVRSLDVASDNGVNPGSRLRFRMEGTPRAQASIRIRGVQGNIPLREVERGIYVGRYVISRADRIEEGAPIRAILKTGNRTTTASYQVPSGMDNVAQVPPPPPPVAAPAPLRIERFSSAPIDGLDPGTELRFMVEATPGALAMVDLPGLRDNVQMREVRPGLYEGSYTIRRSDNINPKGMVVANLRWGERVMTANLSHPLVASDSRGAGNRFPIEITSHPNNGVIEGNVAHLRGRTVPFASVQVRVQAVPPVVGQFGVAQQVFAQTIQADGNGNFEFSFASRIPVPGTRYDVTMTSSKADVSREAHIVLFHRQG